MGSHDFVVNLMLGAMRAPCQRDARHWRRHCERARRNRGSCKPFV